MRLGHYSAAATTLGVFFESSPRLFSKRDFQESPLPPPPTSLSASADRQLNMSRKLYNEPCTTMKNMNNHVFCGSLVYSCLCFIAFDVCCLGVGCGGIACLLCVHWLGCCFSIGLFALQISRSCSFRRRSNAPPPPSHPTIPHHPLEAPIGSTAAPVGTCWSLVRP